MSDVNAMIRQMESTIEFITNKITESELLDGKDARCKSVAQEKLWKALYNLEDTLKILGASPNEPANRKNFNYKARVKELRMTITDLGKAWNGVGN